MCGSGGGGGGGGNDRPRPMPTVTPTPKPKRPSRPTMGAGMGENRGRREQERTAAERGSANHTGYGTVRDDDNKPVRANTKGGSINFKSQKESAPKVAEKAPEVLNKDNETPEEAAASGKGGRNSSFSDRRKTRLSINRNNVSVSTGTKKHRSGLNISK